MTTPPGRASQFGEGTRRAPAIQPGAPDILVQFGRFLGVTGTPTRRYRNKMKALASASWQGANRRHGRSYVEDLQRSHGGEDTLSCCDTSGSAY
ncbi:MAG: hypothetical protein AMXMBFR52_16820 [Burkholderiales bacterium]|jgi:hypothetical protein